ncbi:MAG: ROK family protein [Sphingomonadales bacterium]|nr:ROK family protein [Sphingomonadales bacterium]
MIGGVETGGTKFVLAVGTSPENIHARHVIPTRSPQETLAEAVQWFTGQGGIKALGIASFGPADLNRTSLTWGHITNTPKAGWSGCDIAGYFARHLAVPCGFDTDVNGAALAEYHLGAGKNCASLAYITVGTGIGGGLVLNGQAVHGAAHPEMGHIVPRRAADDTAFQGICPHHGDCLEGLASGPAIIARWGASLSDLPLGHEAHNRVAAYLAQLCHSLYAISAVEMIILGGGVSKAPGLLARVREQAALLNRGYLPGTARHHIAAPGLGEDSGITGAMMLAANQV